MADNFNFVQVQDLYLAGSGVGATDTTIILKSFKYVDDTNVVMADFGTLGFMTLDPNTSREENISFTGITQNGDGTATLTGVTRGLKNKAPYDADTTLRKSHSGSSVAVVSNSAPFYNKMTGKDNDETVTGDWTFAGGVTFTNTEIPIFNSNPTITDDKHIATKKYVDDVAIAGAAKATEAVYGISKLSTAAVSATEPVVVGDNDTRVPTQDENDALAGNDGTPSSANTFVTEDWLSNNTTATPTASKIPIADGSGSLKQWTEVKTFTAGEDLTGATTPQAVYYDTADNTVKVCDGNDTAKLNFLGFAIESVSSTESVKVQVSGIVNGFTSLVEGSYYYVQDDKTIGIDIGTTSILVGIAISETELLIIPNNLQSNFFEVHPYYNKIQDSADTSRNIASLTYVKKKEIKFNDVDGIISVRFSLAGHSGSPIVSAWGIIYINGSAVGTEQHTTSDSYIEYTESVTVKKNDFIQIYCKTGDVDYGSIKNFRLYYGKQPRITKGTINTD